MFEDKNIHDVFEQANLENEDWLQPSDKVLQNIEAEIYRKKKNRWFWFLMSGLLVLLGGFLITYYADLNYTSNQKKSSPLAKTINKNIEKKEEPSLSKNKQFSNEKLEADKKNLGELVDKNYIYNKQKTIPKNEDKVASENEKEIKNQTVKKTKPNESLNKTVTYAKPILKKDKISTSKPKAHIILKRIPRKEIAVIKFQNENKLNKQIINPKKYIDQSIVEKVIAKTAESTNKKNEDEKVNGAENKFTATQRLSLRQTILSNKRLQTNLINLKKDSSTAQNQSIQYQISSGFSWWNFSLNNDYNKALKSANFKHEAGKGFYISTSLQKVIKPRLTVEGNFQYEQIVVNSAHHTKVSYSHEEESTEMTNNFDIEIATPLGFSNSNMGIKRISSNLNEPVDLLIDLESSHQIFNLDAGVNLSAQFIEFVKLNGAIVFGTGLNHVLAIRNELSSLKTNNAQFVLDKLTISEQDNLNKIRPYFGLGLRLNYAFKPSQILQFHSSWGLVITCGFKLVTSPV